MTDARIRSKLESSGEQIVIKEYPFDSPVARQLVSALDDELEIMYPDWRDVLMPDGVSTWLKGIPGANPLPGAHILPSSSSDEELGHGGRDGEKREARDKMHFFVVFASPAPSDEADGPSGGNVREDERNTIKVEMDGQSWEAVGCVGIRELPYFPHKHASDSAASTSSPSTAVTTTTTCINGSTSPSSSIRSLTPAAAAATTTVEPKTAEIKRMYVDPSHRFSGRRTTTPNSQLAPDPAFPAATKPRTEIPVASQILHFVEHFARTQMGIERIVLETGARQVPAMRLYERHGYVRRAPFGEWVGAGEEDGGQSRCYEKMLK